MSLLTQSSDSTTTPGSKAEETMKITNEKPKDDEESKVAMEEVIAKRAAAEASTEVKVVNKKKAEGQAAAVANKKAEGQAAVGATEHEQVSTTTPAHTYCSMHRKSLRKPNLI